MLYCMEIQQLISNIDSGMKHMTFHVQLLNYFTIMEGTMWHEVRQNNFAYATLGHVIEHRQVKGNHMTLNVQHEAHLIYTKGQPFVMKG